MRDIAALFVELDQTTKTNQKVEALAHFFRKAGEKDKLWTMALLSRKRPRRTVNTRLLRTWAAEKAGIPLWLFEESYHIVGDLAETIALVLPPPTSRQTDHPLHYWIAYIRALDKLEESTKKERILDAWNQLDSTERFVFNKLITGGFRIGVSQKLMVRSLAKATDQEEAHLAHRLMGNWHPDDTDFQDLIHGSDPLDDISRPYPFFLAYPLEDEIENLGPIEDWAAEFKWDGIRGQAIIREGHFFLWSRGEELVTHQYPELEVLKHRLPSGTVLDGEILAFRDGQPLSFGDLQKRIGRKKVSQKMMKKIPIVFRAFDLLEWGEEDIREHPFHRRRAYLQEAITLASDTGVLLPSEWISFDEWNTLTELREKAREYHSEGLMLKNRNAPYLSGRKKGHWWKWKVDPLLVDAVMIYAQSGHGRRANLFTDFTFAVKNGEQLVPFTKAYSGLTDNEFREITQWVRGHTLERYGPVRAVPPTHVFEIAFEGIRASSRHKSGIALRFPRISRWRKDKPVDEIDTLEHLKQMLKQYG